MPSDIDLHHMKAAIAMARRSVGFTAENPAVGCVIVDVHGHVIARGRTREGGRPHAETDALEKAGARAKGATLYVTLEPCTHHGKTPPCTDSIIKAGIARVVIGARDPDPRVDGKSRGILEAASIIVEENVLSKECTEPIRGFIMRQVHKRPFITLKAACTIDGKIASQSGDSKWITSDLARSNVHMRRSLADAVLVGVGTALADDPLLTARLGGVNHRGVRVVLDSNLRLGADSALCQSTKDFPLIIFYKDGGADKIKSLEETGAALIDQDPKEIHKVISILAKRGINSLFVEGGASVHASFLKAGLCDELLIYRAGKIIGAEGLDVVGDLNLENMEQSYNFRRVSISHLGVDTLECYQPLEKDI